MPKEVETREIWSSFPVRSIPRSRVPFDAAWGFDQTDSSVFSIHHEMPNIVEQDDCMSLDLDRDDCFFETLPLETSAFSLNATDTFSELGDGHSVSDAITEIVSNASVPLSDQHHNDLHMLSDDSSADRSSSQSSESDIDLKSCFGPRGTSKMVSFMRRSEDTRMEILAQLRQLPAESAVVKETNMSFFYKAQKSRERLLKSYGCPRLAD